MIQEHSKRFACVPLDRGLEATGAIWRCAVRVVLVRATPMPLREKASGRTSNVDGRRPD